VSAPIRYRRLPGRKMGFARCPSAWIAADHILLIGGSRFQETYQRVWFTDLQAVLIRRKPRFVMQWPYLLPFPLILWIFFVGLRSLLGYPVLAACLSAALAIVLLSVRYGCYLDLATAVGNIRVPSVAFTFTAHRFAKKITPAVLSAQQAAAQQT
jgi:hypothetical protein